jgi:hypothetical protein
MTGSADILVSEDNDEMTGSYLMIDPLGRFFWRDGGDGYRYSAPILEVGAAAALNAVRHLLGPVRAPLRAHGHLTGRGAGVGRII